MRLIACGRPSDLFIPFGGAGQDGRAAGSEDHPMRRFHIALAVGDLARSIDDYSRRLGAPPTAVVPGKYAMWRTAGLNFSINELPERAGQLRHLGFEDDAVATFDNDFDVNGIEWERFSPAGQDEKIREMYGVPVAE
jgi:catechol 2,3-dioxygenase-like lactoylglutathione lyase family enzyme